MASWRAVIEMTMAARPATIWALEKEIYIVLLFVRLTPLVALNIRRSAQMAFSSPLMITI
jgi:hypothetical protein